MLTSPGHTTSDKIPFHDLHVFDPIIHELVSILCNNIKHYAYISVHTDIAIFSIIIILITRYYEVRNIAVMIIT